MQISLLDEMDARLNLLRRIDEALARMRDFKPMTPHGLQCIENLTKKREWVADGQYTIRLVNEELIREIGAGIATITKNGYMTSNMRRASHRKNNGSVAQ